MAYVEPNFPTKTALRKAIKEGKRVRVFMPLMGTPKIGTEAIEGPHYPKPHTWYATVETKLDEETGDVIVVKVKS